MTAKGLDLGNYQGIIKSFDPSDHTTNRGVHTFSVVSSPTTDSYHAYAGPDNTGSIDLWESTDLETWQRRGESPVLKGRGVRWASGIRVNGRVYLAIRRATNFKEVLEDLGRHAVENMLPVRERIKRLAWFRSDSPYTYIDLYRSTDGVEFERVDTLVEKDANGNIKNQNPYLFVDGDSDRTGIVYFSGDYSKWQIRLRLADSVRELRTTDDRVLIESDNVLAAPALFYHPQNQRYVLMAEAVDTNSGDWVTECFISKSVTGPYREPEENVIFEDDRACPFVFKTDQRLYVFLSKRIKKGRWVGEWHRYDI